MKIRQAYCNCNQSLTELVGSQFHSLHFVATLSIVFGQSKIVICVTVVAESKVDAHNIFEPIVILCAVALL